ncbi:hypothetical protein [Methylotuvimicrobium alcaliphilum]|uniref:hypothetical protein n=1 Tax=Methylotuvimicrobium alcaliphilum TaxID=271065 RepID=UPI0005FB3B96|nr:hypothetical protein [Methylotuvimicrobium alcaliphilum]
MACKISLGGGFRVSFWLDKDDGERLRKLAGSITDHLGDKTGYADVISEALKRLEIEMTPGRRQKHDALWPALPKQQG